MIERAVLLSGTVGAGKTTVGEEMSKLLGAAGEPHAFIDLDTLSEFFPAPTDDPFNARLVVANLRSITANFSRAGARSLVMSGVVETAPDLEEVRRAIDAPSLAVVLITARPSVVQDRLHQRHAPWDEGGLEWHLDRAPELASKLDSAGIESVRVANEGDPRTCAAAVLAAIGWSTAAVEPAPD